MSGAAPDGAADPLLVHALLTARTGGPAQRAQALHRLATATVYLALTARATEVAADEGTGLRAERSTEMQLAGLVSPSGDRALPVFTGLATLAAWGPDARPRAVGLDLACRAALDDEQPVVVVDVGSPHALVLDHAEVVALADGLVPVAGDARLAVAGAAPATLTAATQVPSALTAALDELATLLTADPVVAAAWLAATEEAPMLPLIAVRPEPGAAGAELAALGARLLPVLERHGCGPVDLMVVADGAPGLVLAAATPAAPTPAAPTPAAPTPPRRPAGRRLRRLLP